MGDHPEGHPGAPPAMRDASGECRSSPRLTGKPYGFRRARGRRSAGGRDGGDAGLDRALVQLEQLRPRLDELRQRRSDGNRGQRKHFRLTSCRRKIPSTQGVANVIELVRVHNRQARRPSLVGIDQIDFDFGDIRALMYEFPGFPCSHDNLLLKSASPRPEPISVYYAATSNFMDAAGHRS